MNLVELIAHCIRLRALIINFTSFVSSLYVAALKREYHNIESSQVKNKVFNARIEKTATS